MREYDYIRWKSNKALPGRPRDRDQIWDVEDLELKEKIPLMMTRTDEATVRAISEDAKGNTVEVDIPWVDVESARVKTPKPKPKAKPKTAA